MSFLQKPDELQRAYLQLKGFLSDTYLEVVSDLLAIPIFRLPKIYFDKQDLLRLKMPERLRLGNRLERFFSFVINESDRYELIMENHQIIHNKITLGELDFIIFDKQTLQQLHVELGGKLYLYDPAFKEELARWIGPNRKDSLLRKTATLKSKQFPLLYREETKKQLLSLGLNTDNLQQQVCFKARLFLPYSLKNNIPEFVASNNIKGFYVTLNEFISAEFKKNHYFLPKKQDWIVAPQYGELWYTFDIILKQVEIALLQKQSPMLWLKKPNQTYETLFVVWW
jgi:hypothetical protein